MDEQKHELSESERARILLVDDDIGILEGVTDLLEWYGYDVVTATNGEEALKVMRGIVPDLVISDIMMPVMDGYAFYEAVRSNPAWVPIPFVFLTARGQQSDIRRGHSLGADAYVTKPFDPDDLLIAIQGRIRRMRDIQTAAHTDIERMKQQLINIFSHELRTPLTYIYGYINLLREQHEELSPDAIAEMLNGVQTGAERLHQLVEDLMLMVRLDSGVVEMEITLRKDRYLIADIIDRAMDRPQIRAEARGVQITADVESGLEFSCVDLYIQDAISRLLDNAIKFSREGEGCVEVSANEQDGNIIITVRDDGIGIDVTQQELIFERFQQINRDLLEQQGVGMGLTLARELIHLHGGRIELDSQPGQGSEFRIVLPLDSDRGS